MRANFLPALSLLLSGCVAMTTAGTREAVLFSGPQEDAHAVLKPYEDLPLSIEFACPDKPETMMTSFVVPFPPVVPVGLVNDHISYLRVTMPEGADDAIAGTRVVAPEGTALSLSGRPQFKRTVTSEGRQEVTYALDKDCEALDGGTLEVAGFSYKNKQYPATTTRLQFESRITGSVAWWPPALFNGGRRLSHDGMDAAQTPAQ